MMLIIWLKSENAYLTFLNYYLLKYKKKYFFYVYTMYQFLVQFCISQYYQSMLMYPDYVFNFFYQNISNLSDIIKKSKEKY